MIAKAKREQRKKWETGLNIIITFFHEAYQSEFNPYSAVVASWPLHVVTFQDPHGVASHFPSD